MVIKKWLQQGTKQGKDIVYVLTGDNLDYKIARVIFV